LWWVVPFNSNPGKKRLSLVAEKVQESKQLRPIAHKIRTFGFLLQLHSLIEVSFHYIRSPKMKRYHINSGCFQFSFSFSFSRDKKKKTKKKQKTENRKSPPKNENLQMTTERRFSSCSSSPSPSCRFPFSAKKFCRREKLCAAHNERRLKIVRET
jgi:hypothetical protein